MILQPAVCMLTSKRNGILYIGVTSNSIKRVWEHRNDLSEGFTKRYQIHQLVWYEMHMTMAAAIAREKQLKNLETRMEDRVNRAAESRVDEYL